MQNPSQPKPTFSWQTLEHPEHHRKADWYWGIGLATIAGIVLAIVAKNFLFAFMIFVGGITLVVFSLNKPNVVQVEIFENGLAINGKPLPFKNIESFFIFDNLNGYTILMVKQNRGVLGKMTIPLGEGIDRYALRDFLGKKLKEEEYKQTITDHIATKLGF